MALDLPYQMTEIALSRFFSWARKILSEKAVFKFVSSSYFLSLGWE